MAINSTYLVESSERKRAGFDQQGKLSLGMCQIVCLYTISKTSCNYSVLLQCVQYQYFTMGHYGCFHTLHVWFSSNELWCICSFSLFCFGWCWKLSIKLWYGLSNTFFQTDSAQANAIVNLWRESTTDQPQYFAILWFKHVYSSWFVCDLFCVFFRLSCRSYKSANCCTKYRFLMFSLAQRRFYKCFHIVFLHFVTSLKWIVI